MRIQKLNYETKTNLLEDLLQRSPNQYTQYDLWVFFREKNRSCLYRKTFTSDAGAKSVYKSVCENFYGLYCIPCKGRKYAAYGGNKQT